MSPSEDNPTPAPETAETAEAPENSADSTVESAPMTEPQIPADSPERAKPSPKFLAKLKNLSKKQKIALFAGGWVAALGAVAVVAFLTKPAPEIVYTDAIIEAYKFAESADKASIETVDDLDYYGTYTPNPLTFTEVTEGNASGALLISGLKNKSVEEKINNRIKSVASAVRSVIDPERTTVYTNITANYFNLLSMKIGNWDSASEWRDEYLTFNLNTGDELRFDDLFSPNADLVPLLTKSFYDSLSTDIKFDRLAAERRLSMESVYPNPAQCFAQYCPLPGETYASLRALIADYDAQLANIEQITLETIRSYLSGERKFYLNSYGPAFVLADGRTIDMELRDNIRYAIYLKKYRSPESIFEHPAPASTPFFTEVSDQNTNYINEETDNYLFDYAESISPDASDEERRALRDYIKNKALSLSGDSGKFRHILADGTVSNWGGIRAGYFSVCVTETDKSYYKSTYKKAIIDGKTQSVTMSTQQPARSGRYDPEKVHALDPLQGDSCFEQIHVAITDSGAVLDSVDGILVNASADDGWEDFLKGYAYSMKCRSSYDPVCYTDEEKRSHKLSYVFGGSSIYIRLAGSSKSDWTQLGYIDLRDVPARYLNPAIVKH